MKYNIHIWPKSVKGMVRTVVSAHFISSTALCPYCLILLLFIHDHDLLMQLVVVSKTATRSQIHSLDSSTRILNVSGMFLRKKFNQGILNIIIRLTIITLNGNLLGTSDNHYLLLSTCKFICNNCMHLVLFKSCTSFI